MANKKITDLTALGATPATGDFLAVVDISDTSEAATGTTKKVAFSDIATGAALADDSVTNAKLANMATQTIKGRTTAGTGDPEDLTATQATAILNNVVGDSGAGGTKGLVPAPGAGDAAAGKFLKADGTFAVPAGSGAEAGANSDITSMDGLTGALENPTQIIFPEAAAPGTPGAGKVTLYAKTDGLLYSKDDAGLETVVTGGGGGTPGGSNTQVQFNDSSAFGGDAELTYNKTTNTLVVPNVNPGSLDGGNSGTSSNYWANVFGTNLNARTKIAFNGQASSNDAIRLDVPNNGTGSNGLGPIRIRENNVSTGSTFAFTPESPAQITADQNNYSPSSNSKYQRWNTDASRNITGWQPWGGVANLTGAEYVIVNVGSFDIVLKHENASSTTTNRFLCSTGADITLTANQAVDVFYDGTTQRWRVFKRN